MSILHFIILFYLFRIHDIEEKYYADGENAYSMRKYFVDKNLVINQNDDKNKEKTKNKNEMQ